MSRTVSRAALCSLFAITALSLFVGAPAFAQKSKDELRFAINDMFPVADPYVFPHDEAGVVTRTIYSPLFAFQEKEKKFVGLVAKAWRVVSPGVYEFDLRDDITFHSGNKLTADDVIYTLNFFADPAAKIRFKQRYDWFHPVEKLGEYNVRIRAKVPQSDDFAKLAYRSRILDKKIHEPLGYEKYGDYGRISASGSGPYKMVSIDKQKIVLEKFTNVKDDVQRQAVNRYVGINMPDEQSQIAQLLTGGVDAIRNVSPDNAKSLGQNPNLKVKNVASGDIVYITLDAAGRSKNKAMTDQRVRKALMMSIDRDSLIRNIVPGAGTADKLKMICFEWTLDCSSTTQTQSYDPNTAKRLLAEAGFPNGLDLQLDVHEPVREIAEAVAGELRKVGIRASVQPMPLAVYVKKRGDGEFTAFMGFYPTSAQPEAGNIMDFFFGQDRDYYRDDILLKAMNEGPAEFDEKKRQAMYRTAVDRVNEMNYIVPFSSLPTAYAMSKDVDIAPDVFSYTAVYLNDLVWADYKGK